MKKSSRLRTVGHGGAAPRVSSLGGARKPNTSGTSGWLAADEGRSDVPPLAEVDGRPEVPPLADVEVSGRPKAEGVANKLGTGTNLLSP